MKSKAIIYFNIIIILLFLTGCWKNSQRKDNKHMLKQAKQGQLIEVTQANDLYNISGFKVENNEFIFNASKDDKWGYFSLNLHNYKIDNKYQDIGIYDSYIALNNGDFIFLDVENRLFIKKDGKEEKIDEEVYGSHSPNILVSPDKKNILYTKGEEDGASLYLYTVDTNKSEKIKEDIANEAFLTFSYTSQWSNNSNYFIFNNNEVFHKDGDLYINIDATSAKWSPKDDFIGFIRKPKDVKDKKVFASDWQTYIGNEFILLNLKDKKEKIIYTNNQGIIDVIDSIQWSQDSNILGISIGKINKGLNGELRNIEYEYIYTYNIKQGIGKEIENIPYNFYEIILNNYIYGSSIGKRDKVEVVEITNNNRKIFNHPVILNSKDMFVIRNHHRAYLANGTKLVELDSDGGEANIIEFPWEVNEVYFDSNTKQFIIINKDLQIFILKI